MTTKPTQSLAIKLSAPIIGVGLLVIVVTFVLISKNYNSDIEQRIAADTENAISSILIAADIDISQANINRIISSIAARDNILEISLINPRTKKIIASSEHNLIQDQFANHPSTAAKTLISRIVSKNSHEQATLNNGPLLYKIKRVRLIDPEINRLRPYLILLVYNKQPAIEKARHDVFVLLLLFSSGIIITLITTNIAHQKHLLKPLNKVISAINNSKHRNELNPISFTSNDEIGALANAYNKVNNDRILVDSELQKIRSHIDGITQQAPVLLAYMDQEGHLPFTNLAFNRFFGIESRAIPLQTFGELLGSPLRESAESIMKKVVSSGTPASFEQSIANAVGDIRHLYITISPDRDESGVKGLFLCIEDLTENKIAEDKIAQYAQDLEFQAWALEEQKEKAESATLAKSNFLARMSHEIRTPINGVLGMLKLLLQENISDTAKRYGDLAKVSAESLLGLINDILDFSKIEAGKLVLEEVDFDINQLLLEVYETFAVRLKNSDINLEININNIHHPWVKGDPLRIRQVFNNLLSNAIKFTDSGQIILEASMEEVSNNAIILQASVKDTGIGIPQDKLATLFDSFSQADSSTTRKYGGTGLGLAISKQLCELMNGDINIISTPGEGSEFSFSITLKPSTEKAVDAASQHHRAFNPSNLNLSKVLLVEDNAINVEVAKGILEDFGVSIDWAENGALALAKLQSLPPEDYYDLILMDCQMPVMDGYTTTRKIRQGVCGDRFTGVPIIAMTANAMQGDREKCLDAGMNDYISKPIDVTLLAEKLSYWSNGNAIKAEPATIEGEQQAHDLVWDKEAALKRVRWKQERLKALVETYLKSSHKNFQVLQLAVKNGDMDAVMKTSHSLKGSAGNLGLMQFYSKLQNFETLAKEGKSNDVTSLLPELSQAFNDAEQALKVEL